MGRELDRRDHTGTLQRADADVLQDNAMGIAYGDGTPVEKLGRLVRLVPMALEVVDEARDTIRRLRDENEQLRAENLGLRAENAELRAENAELRGRLEVR